VVFGEIYNTVQINKIYHRNRQDIYSRESLKSIHGHRLKCQKLTFPINVYFSTKRPNPLAVLRVYSIYTYESTVRRMNIKFSPKICSKYVCRYRRLRVFPKITPVVMGVFLRIQTAVNAPGRNLNKPVSFCFS